MDGGMHVSFQDAMQLEALARGNAQRTIPIAFGKLILYQVLLGREHAAGNTRTYHELVGFILAGLARVAEVAVFLLVNAVELDELYLRFGETWAILSQFFSYLPPQIVALALDTLDF